MTLIYFILILGIVVFIHEFGHFIFAKKAGIYVYEFSIGMGPRIFKFNRKNDETEYSIRLFPIGGFVQMAGEEVEADEKIPEEKRLQSKTWMQKFMTVIAGVMFNFILGYVILVIIYLVSGVPVNNMKIAKSTIKELSAGDTIIKVNDKNVNNYDMLTLQLQIVDKDEFTLTVKGKDSKLKTVSTKLQSNTTKNKEKSYYYEFELDGSRQKGIFLAFKYAFIKFLSTIEQMIFIVFYLITGTLSLSALSGPVGIYSAIGMYAKMGFLSLLSILCLITINVGFINLLPLPAFDGGRVLFLIIEKIKGSPVNPKVENIIHSIGFFLLMMLMIFITYNDIIRLFK